MKHTRKANKKKSTRRKKNLVKKHTRKHKRSYRRKVQRGGDPTIDEAIEQLQTWTSHLDENKKQIDEFTRIDLELAAKLAKFEKSLETLLNLKKISEDFDLKAKAKKETLEKEIGIHNGLVASYNARKNSESDEKKVNKLVSLINDAQVKKESLNDELMRLNNQVAENNNNLNDPTKGTLARLVFVNKGVDEIQKKMKDGDDKTFQLIRETNKLDAQIDSFLKANILLVGRHLFDTPDDAIAISLQQILKIFFESNRDKDVELENLYKKLTKEKKDDNKRSAIAAQKNKTELDNAVFAEQMKEVYVPEEKEEGEQSLNEKTESATNTDSSLGVFGLGYVKKRNRRKNKGTLKTDTEEDLETRTEYPKFGEADFPPLPKPPSPKSSKTSDEPTVVNEEKTKKLRQMFPQLAKPVDEKSVEAAPPSVENPVYTQTIEPPPTEEAYAPTEEASATIDVAVPVVKEIVNSNQEHEFHYTTQGQMPLIFTIRQEEFTDLDGINMELLNLFFTTTSIPGFMIPNIINSGGKILGMIDELYPRTDNTTYLDCFNQNERLFSTFPCFTDFFYIYMFELLGTYFRWFPYYIRDPNILVNLVFRIITFVFPLKDTMVYTRYFTNELFKMISMYNSQQHIFLLKTYYDFELYLPDAYGNYYKPYEYDYLLSDGKGGMYRPYPL